MLTPSFQCRHDDLGIAEEQISQFRSDSCPVELSVDLESGGDSQHEFNHAPGHDNHLFASR